MISLERDFTGVGSAARFDFTPYGGLQSDSRGCDAVAARIFHNYSYACRSKCAKQYLQYEPDKGLHVWKPPQN